MAGVDGEAAAREPAGAGAGAPGHDAAHARARGVGAAAAAIDASRSPWTLFHRNPRLLVLAVALIAVGGLSAWTVLPRAEDPALVDRFALVEVAFPGASAERVEALVTDPVEDALAEIDEIRRVDSVSRTGQATLKVELREEVADVDRVWSRIRDELSEVAGDLPRGAGAPRLVEMTVTAYSLVYALVWEGGPAPDAAAIAGGAPDASGRGPLVLGRLGRALEERLRAVPGTGDVDAFGEGDEEVRVEVDPARLAALGLTPDDLARAVAESDAKAAAGLVRAPSGDLLVLVEGEVDRLERLRRVPVRTGRDARTVPLGDVARVTKGVASPRRAVSLVEGRPAAVVAARMAAGGRIDRWAARGRGEVAAFAAGLPSGVRVVTLFDQSGYTEERLSALVSNLGAGALLVVGVLLVTMGLRSALLVGAALPLTALAVLAGLRALSVPIHQMSVTGLIIALGLLIDNAIVVVDEARRLLARGLAVPEAILRTCRTLAVPLFASTLTTVLAFLPIALMPGGAGEFVGTIAISVILALAASLAISLTIVPALVGLAERWRSSAGAFASAPGVRGFLARGVTFARAAPRYERALGWLYARPAAAIALAAAPAAVGIVLGARLDEQFFPGADRDQFQIEMRLWPHAGLEDTVERALRVRERLLAHPEVRAVHWFVGENAAKTYYNMLQGSADGPRYAQALVQLASSDGAYDLMRELQRELDREVPDAQIVLRPFEQGPPFDAPVEMRILGPDLDTLRNLGEALQAELSAVPGVAHARTTLVAGRPELGLALDEERALAGGLTHGEVARQLRAQLEGVVGGSLTDGTEDLPVRVRLSDGVRGDLGRLADLELIARGGVAGGVAGGGEGAGGAGGDAGSGSASSGAGRGAAGSRDAQSGAASASAMVSHSPLASLGGFTLRPELGAIARRAGVRVNTVQGLLDPGVLPAAALARFEARLRERGIAAPEGYRFERGGESAERDQAMGNLMASAVVLLVLMMATLVLSLGSFRAAAIIAAVGALAAGYGFLALAAFGYPRGFMAIIGTMGLIGVAINDSIVVLTALREDPLARTGDVAGIVAVVVRETRHVLSTTLTTALGFVPLLLEGGLFWPPLAVSIAGGVIGATLVGLSFTPALHQVLARACAPGAAPASTSATRVQALLT